MISNESKADLAVESSMITAAALAVITENGGNRMTAEGDEKREREDELDGEDNGAKFQKFLLSGSAELVLIPALAYAKTSKQNVTRVTCREKGWK